MRKKISNSAKKKNEIEQDWRNEHGQPNFEFLKSLSIDETPSSLEKLSSIAQDLNVNYNQGTSNEELIDRILSRIRSDPTITS